METWLALLAAYLWGGFPTAYLVARWKAGIDLRRVGSGNVGAANVAHALGARMGILVGFFDALGKGTLPLVIARAVGLSPWQQMGVGLALVAGHNWSPYLRFTGGRGVATSLGVLLGASLPGNPWELWGMALVVAPGWLARRSTAFWVGIGFLSLPLWALSVPGRPRLWLAVGLLGLMVLKRLLANWERPGNRYPWTKVLLWRLLYDRDVPPGEPWQERGITRRS
jgi:glycerol-3-phosphate acyltransferase PlsY